MTEDEMRAELKELIIRKYKTLSYYALCHNISVAYVSAILTGRKAIPEYMLERHGYVRKISYEET